VRGGRSRWRRGLRLTPAAIVVSAFAAAAATGALAVALLEHAGRSGAERSAREVTRLAGEGIVEPLVTPAVLAGDPAAVRRLDAVVHRRVLRDPFVRLKIWTSDGRIVYSDEPRLLGRRYPLRADDLHALRTGAVVSDVSDLEAPENGYERHLGKLLQVYLPIRATDGRRLLFEAYIRDSSITESGRRLWRTFLPALLLGLVALQLVNIPVSRSFARRLQRGERERTDLFKRALETSDRERRRIASDLHDGVVQDLTAVALTLDSAAGALTDGDRDDALEHVVESRDLTRQSIRSLRLELVDIYPPDLLRRGLSSALADLASVARHRGLDARLSVAEGFTADPDVEALLFRVGQEGVRNVLKHAAARSVEITLASGRDSAVVEVRDDGQGIAREDLDAADHFGLRGLRDVVADAGGTLTVEGRQGGGTVLRAEVPRR
jgi:two-component system, NarL family, sensor kinase